MGGDGGAQWDEKRRGYDGTGAQWDGETWADPDVGLPPLYLPCLPILSIARLFILVL